MRTIKSRWLPPLTDTRNLKEVTSASRLNRNRISNGVGTGPLCMYAIAITLARISYIELLSTRPPPVTGTERDGFVSLLFVRTYMYFVPVPQTN
ncbi:hypothetical protein EVAR_20137_1 [Eumeta japonica]|uniref:Uncharacterized protein n=1 Tax=Eumeta variegata TaxID=151549 RepID=A0A4C1V3U4_EUMVA|nr:hypothetical protein EVAR_20137_1 [Eumeta japonica]